MVKRRGSRLLHDDFAFDHGIVDGTSERRGRDEGQNNTKNNFFHFIYPR